MVQNHFKPFYFILILAALVMRKNTSCAPVTERKFPDSSRVANGRPATSCPYQVQVLSLLKNDMTVVCSGAIIDHRWILTAAHCISSSNIPMAVLAGAKTLFRAKKERTYKVIKRVKHPQYADRGGICYNDIGLIKVDREIDFDPNHVEAINFKETINVPEGTVLRVAGWGRTEKRNNMAMMETVMKVENNVACQLKGYHPLTDSHICASPVLTGSMDCQGDSGGPVTDVDRKSVIGLVSFGYDAKCPSKFPSVYTKVTAYVSWIEQVMLKDQLQHSKTTHDPPWYTTPKTPRFPHTNNTHFENTTVVSNII